MVKSYQKYGSGPKSGPELQGKPHIQHDSELDDFRADFEITE
jgi:hypothetical protein